MLPYLDNENEEEKQAVVIEFSLNLSQLVEVYLHTHFFHYDEEFAEFVIDNRSYPDALKHNYDFIIGVMSDSNPEGLLADYRLNKISKEELIHGMMKWTSVEQLSLHNQDIVIY